ncbi:MAG: RNA polymerase sigma factor [Clostridium lundense]|nr:RNA polymerase sigma factor [Clostridium lundense]
MDEDLRLVKEVLKGNLDSFNIIVNKYELPILRFIYNLIKNTQTAEDITQDVFITVYNKLYLYKSEYKFSNWIFQIARNKCIDYIRKNKKTVEANIDEMRELASKEATPQDLLEFKEMKEQVEKFLCSLEEVDRQIVLLRYSGENTTFHDIAQIMKISESSVKRRYYNAREKFKKSISIQEKRCRG